MSFLCVGAGGAIGAMLRYAVSLLPYKGSFPVLTLLVNLAGAFLIGVISGAAVRKKLNGNIVLFLKTGVCGGFTTFSTFSLEAFELFRAEHRLAAVIYIVLSVGLCLCGVLGGILVSEKAV